MIPSHFVSQLALRRDAIDSLDRYPFNLPAVRTLDRLELHPAVTYLVGENGSGKSTLLEALAVALGFNPEGGSKNVRFTTRSSHSNLHEFLRVTKGFRRPQDGWFLRAESFFNVATEIELLDAEPARTAPIIASYGGRSLHEQSHGESFLSLLMNRFGGHGLYLMDEPEAALSPQRQLSVLSRIHELVMAESQFVIATHSPILMAYPDAWIYQCTEAGLERVAYLETEHYQVAKDFLENPARMLRVLMAR